MLASFFLVFGFGPSRLSILPLKSALNNKMSILPQSDNLIIREVWADNLEEEFVLIREIVNDYPYIAMDTEFPGTVVKPVGNFKTASEFRYYTLKYNVDILKLIQLGLTFSNKDGNLPRCGTDKDCIWQFNFREFNTDKDMHAIDSVKLLENSGIDFKKNNEKGIDAHLFRGLLMSSGMVLNDNIHWVTFHGGYDFGYIVKLLTCQQLPSTPEGFFIFVKKYFPNVYDIKHLMTFCNDLYGGLNNLAKSLDVKRIGVCHQAGSDSLLTSSVYSKLRQRIVNGSIKKYAGVLYGLDIDNGHSVH